MNNKRREIISRQVNVLNYVKSELENVLFEEEESYDNIPENLQESDRAMESEEAQDLLNDAVDSINDVITYLEGIN